MRFLTTISLISVTCLSLYPVRAGSQERLDLSSARIVTEANEGVLAKAAAMLQEEIEERTGLRLSIVNAPPADDTAAIILQTMESGPKVELEHLVPPIGDAYSLWVETETRKAPTVHLLGHDDRGGLFAAGRLLRLLAMENGKLSLPSGVDLSTAPKYPIRGHQLGYRETANTYDAWDLETYEQYFRDLICFGANSIELITSLNPKEFDGPVMTESQWDRNVKLVELADSYGLDVWFWMPLDGDVTKPKVAQKELDDRLRFFKACKDIDHIMIPGGDPGRTAPEVLMPWMERMAEVLHSVFPHAGLWVSNQKFTYAENDVLFEYLQKERPKWLEGVVFGPGTFITIADTRKRTPEEYRLRRYPDITHCVRCQYPVPEWDGIFAQTLDREPPNPRPEATAHIHNVWAKHSDGFVSYSDGAHDDLNKMIWNALGWDPETPVDNILEDYGRLFLCDEAAKEIAQGLRLLEENWKGPVLENEGIDRTLEHWLAIEKKYGAELEGNWRFQMYLFRALFDASIRARLQAEHGYEREAYETLSKAPEIGAEPAIAQARVALAQADRKRIRTDLRLRIEDLGVELAKSIGYQMSIDEPYRARNPERGALLDKIDRPLNDRPWLEAQFAEILAESDEEKRLARIDRIVRWEDPGEGGFYDDLGCAWKQPHLVRQTTWSEDPMFILGPQESHYRSMDNVTRAIPPLKYSWLDQAETDYGVPLLMRYTGLDPSARYRIRITYSSRYQAIMRLVADKEYEIHGALPQPDPIWPVEFEAPAEATRDGVLDLAWELVEGRGCQVAEVWLLKD